MSYSIDVIGPHWTFLTNYAHVLLTIAADPGIRLREAAIKVGITERAAQRIVADLIEAGYLTVEKDGRRNHYRIDPTLPLRHPVERHNQIAALLKLVEAPINGCLKTSKQRTAAGD